MNSKQYAKMMEENLKKILAENEILEGTYTQICLSADRTKYEILMKDGLTKYINSGFDYFED